MNIYQMFYTRKGRQELGAGWQVAGKSEEVMPDMVSYYSGMRSKETELLGKYGQENKSLPENVFELEREGHYLYLTAANYHVQGLDLRGNAFYHGLIFYIRDFFQLCKHPENICGLGKGTFTTQTGNESQLPTLKQVIPDYSFDFHEIAEKYHLTLEHYTSLMKAVYWKLFHPEKSFCIRARLPIDLLEQCCREIMYVIYTGLPYQFRVNLTFSSFVNPQEKIFFSNEAEGNYYFNLETGECCYEQDSTEAFPYQDELIRRAWYGEYLDSFYTCISQICEDAWGNNLNIIGNLQMQVVCDALIKEIPVNRLSHSLDEVLNMEARVCEELNNYIAFLIDRIYNAGIPFSETQVAKLTERIRLVEDGELKDKYCYLFAAQFCEEKTEKNYGRLYQLKSNNSEQYWKIIEILKQGNKSFLHGYFKDYICRFRIRSLAQLEECTDGFPMAYEDEMFYPVWEAVLFVLFENELEKSKNNDTNDSLLREYLSYSLKCMREEKEKKSYITGHLNDVFWTHFVFGDFRYESITQYQRWGLEDAAVSNNKAKLVSNLVKKEQEWSERFNEQSFLETFSGKEGEVEANAEHIINDFRSACQSWQNSVQDNPVAMLWLYYSPKAKAVNSSAWFSWVSKPGRLKKEVYQRYQGAWKKLREFPEISKSFAADLEGIIRRCKKNKEQDLARELENIRRLILKIPVVSENKTLEDVAPLYRKVLLAFAGLLALGMAAKMIHGKMASFGLGGMIGAGVLTAIMLSVSMILFRAEDHTTLAELPGRLLIPFICMIVALCLLCAALCAALWMSKSIVVLIAVMVITVVLLGIRFLFY